MKSRGFTLIELIIVVVIIGILAAISIPKFSDVSESARRSACRANMRTIASQEMIYFSMHISFTDDMTLLGMSGLVCPAGDAYTFTGMTTDILNIQCANSGVTGSHGSIDEGVASWRDYN